MAPSSTDGGRMLAHRIRSQLGRHVIWITIKVLLYYFQGNPERSGWPSCHCRRIGRRKGRQRVRGSPTCCLLPGNLEGQQGGASSTVRKWKGGIRGKYTRLALSGTSDVTFQFRHLYQEISPSFGCMTAHCQLRQLHNRKWDWTRVVLQL